MKAHSESLLNAAGDAVEKAGYELDPDELEKLVSAADAIEQYPPDSWILLGRAVSDTQFGEAFLDDAAATIEDAGYDVEPDVSDGVFQLVNWKYTVPSDAFPAAGRAVLDSAWAEQFLEDSTGALKTLRYELDDAESRAVKEAARFSTRPTTVTPSGTKPTRTRSSGSSSSSSPS